MHIIYGWVLDLPLSFLSVLLSSHHFTIRISPIPPFFISISYIVEIFFFICLLFIGDISYFFCLLPFLELSCVTIDMTSVYLLKYILNQVYFISSANTFVQILKRLWLLLWELFWSQIYFQLTSVILHWYNIPLFCFV